MSKKSLPIFYSKLLYKMGQDFFDKYGMDVGAWHNISKGIYSMSKK